MASGFKPVTDLSLHCALCCYEAFSKLLKDSEPQFAALSLLSAVWLLALGLG